MVVNYLQKDDMEKEKERESIKKDDIFPLEDIVYMNEIVNIFESDWLSASNKLLSYLHSHFLYVYETNHQIKYSITIPLAT